MKHWQSQIFPIVLLALLAALTFWLQKANESEEARISGKLRHDPDAIAENLVARRFDEHGAVRYRLTAPRLMHFPDTDTSELDSPVLTSYRPDTPPVVVSGKRALVTAKGESIFLRDDVRIVRGAAPGRPEMVARMPDLTIQPDAGIAFTQSPVELTQGNSWLKGVGAHLDNNRSTLVLQSQVTGLYIRPKVKP